MEKKLRLTFYGGAGHVTGANFMLSELGDEGYKILIDCGMFQGAPNGYEMNQTDFLYDPSFVDVLLVTHAHADHIGRIGKLVRDGFRGKIYSTQATRELAEVMFKDSLNIMFVEAKQKGLPPMYEKADVERALSLWIDVPYHQDLELENGFRVHLKDAGHILGSAIIELSYREKKIVFTGDLGNSPSPLLQDTEFVRDVDYMVIESVYGDRNHEEKNERLSKLENIIKEVIEKRGVLIIPAFSIERTQILLYELNSLIESKVVENIPVFLDSPLAIKTTSIYKKHLQDMNDEVLKLTASGDDIFDFPNLKFTDRLEESDQIESTRNPKIIIAGSGMSDAGRVKRHYARYLFDERTTVLLVGYQAPGSLGRRLEEGAKKVFISDREVRVRAKVQNIRGYSAHKDSEGLLDFIENASNRLKKVFVVMGEPRSSTFLAQRIRDYLDIEAICPNEGDSFELEF